MRLPRALPVALVATSTLALAKPPSKIPPGAGWYCPSGPVRGFPLQCQRTVEDCRSLVATANLNNAAEDPSCIPRPRAFCHSFRPRVGGGEYGPPEACCFAKETDCEASRREGKSFGDAGAVGAARAAAGFRFAAPLNLTPCQAAGVLP
jgi:hypothetical protein